MENVYLTLSTPNLAYQTIHLIQPCLPLCDSSTVRKFFNHCLKLVGWGAVHMHWQPSLLLWCPAHRPKQQFFLRCEGQLSEETVLFVDAVLQQSPSLRHPGLIYLVENQPAPSSESSVPLSKSPQQSWWGLVLAETHPVQWVTAYFQGNVVHYLFTQYLGLPFRAGITNHGMYLWCGEIWEFVQHRILTLVQNYCLWE